MIIYHNVYEKENGQWCVTYTENNELKERCFDNNEDAINFYMS